MKCAWLLALMAALSPVPATPHDHSEVRQFVIRSQLAQAGDNVVVFAGDSITESALLPSQVCGHPIVNAGIGGATASSYLQAMRGIPEFKASAIIIAIGTNNAVAGDDFPQTYSELTAALGTYTTKLLLAGIPPIESGPIGDTFDVVKSQKIDEEIKRIAGDNFIDLRTELNSGHETIDGIHLSPSGYGPWMNAIFTKLRVAFKC